MHVKTTVWLKKKTFVKKYIMAPDEASGLIFKSLI